MRLYVYLFIMWCTREQLVLYLNLRWLIFSTIRMNSHVHAHSGGLFEMRKLAALCFPVVYKVVENEEAGAPLNDEEGASMPVPQKSSMVGAKRKREDGEIDRVSYKRAVKELESYRQTLSDRGYGNVDPAAVVHENQLANAYDAARTEQENELRLIAVYFAIDQWRARHMHVPVLPNMPSYHVCSSAKCSFTRMRITIWNTRDPHAKHEICLRDGKGVVRNVHVCVTDTKDRMIYCDHPNNRLVHYSERWTFEHLYLCERSSIPHLCGSYCDRSDSSISDDQISTCPISGMADERSRAMHDKQYNVCQTEKQQPGSSGGHGARKRVGTASKRMPTSADCSLTELRDCWCGQVIGSKTISGVLQKMSELPSVLDNNYREIYYCLAVGYVWMILCDERFNYETARELGALQRMNSLIDIQFSQHQTRVADARARYGKKVLRRVQPLYATSIVGLIYKSMAQKVRCPLLDYEASPAFVMKMADQIVKLWYVVNANVAHTNLRSMIPFPDFVWPAMEVMAHGFVLPSRSVDLPDIQVIEPIYTLEMLLPSYAMKDDQTAGLFCGMRSMRREVQSKELDDIISRIVNRTRDPGMFNPTRMDIERMQQDKFVPLANMRTYYQQMSEDHKRLVERLSRSSAE